MRDKKGRFAAIKRDPGAPLPVAIPIIPQVPVSYSTTQPLPGIALNVQSVLRDILEQKLPVDTLKKLR